MVGTRFRRGYRRVVGGVLEEIGGLARLSEGVPNAPFEEASKGGRLMVVAEGMVDQNHGPTP